MVRFPPQKSHDTFCPPPLRIPNPWETHSTGAVQTKTFEHSQEPSQNLGRETPPLRKGKGTYQRTPWGGGKKRGGGETSRLTPLPKRGLEPPSYGTFSTPLVCRCSVFPVQNSTTEQTRSSVGGVQNFSGGRVLWYVFLNLSNLLVLSALRPSRVKFALTAVIVLQ